MGFFWVVEDKERGLPVWLLVISIFFNDNGFVPKGRYDGSLQSKIQRLCIEAVEKNKTAQEQTPRSVGGCLEVEET